MKKYLLLFAVGLLLSGCASTSPAVNYRFSGDTDLNTFQIRTESGFGVTKILFINGAAVDTISGISGFKPSDTRILKWNGKTVEFSAAFHYYVLWSSVSCRVKVNNELVLEE